MSSLGEEAVGRCAWSRDDPLLRTYHDREWGVPEYDSRALWEKLTLDGFQAGLSWLIILRKRDAFRAAFRQFDPEKVARLGERDVVRLLQNPGIVRSRAKIEAAIGGARVMLAMKSTGEDLSRLAWGMAGGVPIQRSGRARTQTRLSGKISDVLKSRGFKFVGPVIVYAWMQATGIVNDHATECFRRPEVQRLARPRADQGTENGDAGGASEARGATHS
ncbi:MAG: DNA-3-methyladenine glycosylase I [Thermoplasmata archaeon]